MSISDDEMRSALRAEAARHQPDREAMLDRITMAATSEPVTRRRAPGRGPRVRVMAAAAAVVALFAGGGVANWALAGNDAAPAPVPPASPAPASSSPALPPPAVSSPARPSTAPSSSAGGSASPSANSPKSPSAQPSKSVDASPSPAPAKGQPGNTRVEQGPLWSDGSVVDGSSVVTLKVTEEVTSLEVVIRVARTEGLTSRGGTKRTPGGSVTTSVTEQADAFQYRFVLSTADRLPPGEYTFTARYSYPAETRDAGGDTYEVVASTGSSPPLNVYGNFYPTG
jgi:hypothetical protein